MAEELTVILNELKSIRTYLIKIGPKRRVGKTIEVNKEKLYQLLGKYNTYNETLKISLELGTLSTNEVTLINKISSEIVPLFSELNDLCNTELGQEDFPSYSGIRKMEGDRFDLKIALSLLHVMNDDDDNTKQLIEGIDYYDSVLTKPECKNKLIQFVLKSRLSQKAKLKLLPKYDTVHELIKDMRRYLLPKKSYTAIQTRLQKCRQNDKSITDFGKEISELFVDLTISQADGNSDNYDVLRPLNEKTAIKRFADGLRNRRLSTIIAARDFCSLTEAIQAAQDEVSEEVPTSSNRAEVLGMYKYHNNTSRRAQRSQYRGYRNSTSARSRVSNGYTRVPNHRLPMSSRGKFTYPRNSFRGRGTYRGQGVAHGNVNFMATDHPQDDANDSHKEKLNQFFRV